MCGDVEFYLAVTATVVCLLSSAGSLPSDKVAAEGNIESKKLEVITANLSSLKTNSTEELRSFQCVIKGLGEEDLNRLASNRTNDTVTVTVNGNNSSSGRDNESRSEPQVFNVKLRVINSTLLVNGDVLAKDGDDIVFNNNSCEIVFQDSEARAAVEGYPPKILTSYNHVVLMNGAPDQIISCTASGHPSPIIRWVDQGRVVTNAVALSKDSSNREKLASTFTSYLLFSQVNHKTSSNYTCIAENEFGTARKTFEVEAVSVEAINPHCNDVSDSSERSTEYEVIFKHDINDILSRSKRHLWYQWRGTKYYVPPFNRPLDLTKSPAINTDLQKMVNFITERLKLADKVAVNKWDNHKPVEDVPREQIILDNMVSQAKNRGLEPRWAYQFFRDQIEANKDIQFELIRIWRLQGRRPYGPPVDLANEVRPQIDLINDKLIQLAKTTLSERGEFKCRHETEKNARYSTFLYNLDPLHQKALQKAVQNLCLFPVFRPAHDPY